MSKKCIICNKIKNGAVWFNSMATYMKFRIERKITEKTIKDLNGSFVCPDCQDQSIEEIKE